MRKSTAVVGGALGTVVAVALAALGATQTTARTLYVDRSLTSSCNTYSVALKNCSGEDGLVYPTIQAAADAVRPGDRVLVRGGVYALSSHGENVISRSGTAIHPIVFEGYRSEQVVVRGVGFEDRDLNGDGHADGPADRRTRSALIRITGSYVEVRKMEVELAPYRAIQVDGSDGLIEEVRIRHCWMACVAVSGSRNLLRYVEVHNARHHPGIYIVPLSGGPGPASNKIVRSLSYSNGRDASDRRVLPIPGDPVGGGNSDGLAMSKACKDAFPTNACTDELVLENIFWRNIDDGMDVSPARSWILGNVSIDNGPAGARGIKVLREGPGNVFSGNVALAIHHRGFELRGKDTMAVLHNLAVGNTDKGIWSVTRGSANGTYHNNIGYKNLSNVDLRWIGGEAENNWATAQGNPLLAHMTASINLVLPTGTVEQRWQHVMNQVVAAFTPVPGSPLIDSGRIVPGFHCPTADDNASSPMSPSASCRHWAGTAPDIGPFEFGLGMTSGSTASGRSAALGGLVGR
jgi:hypothetical protein